MVLSEVSRVLVLFFDELLICIVRLLVVMVVVICMVLLSGWVMEWVIIMVYNIDSRMVIFERMNMVLMVVVDVFLFLVMFWFIRLIWKVIRFLSVVKYLFWVGMVFLNRILFVFVFFCWCSNLNILLCGLVYLACVVLSFVNNFLF